MKSKKVTMLAAALVVAVVALAGVGYATQYTAKTTNTGNSLESTYLTITQTSGASYNTPLFDKIYYDTENMDNTTKFIYTPKATHSYNTTNGEFTTANPSGYALVTKALTLTVSRVGTTTTAVNVDITISNCVKVGDFTYTLVLGKATTNEGVTTIDVTDKGELVFNDTAKTASYSKTGLTLFDNTEGSVKDTAELEVFLFVSGTATLDGTSAIRTAGFNQSVGDPATTDSVFTFKVTALQ